MVPKTHIEWLKIGMLKYFWYDCYPLRTGVNRIVRFIFDT